MASKYTLKIVTDFASAHTLRDYPGACSRMHGHNWKVELELESTHLNEIGMAVVFKAMNQATTEICDRLDHRYSNEKEPFTEINPSSENVAKWLFDSIKKKIDDKNVSCSSVTVWESESSSATYFE